MNFKKLKKSIILFFIVIIQILLTSYQSSSASCPSAKQIDFISFELEKKGYHIQRMIGKGEYGIVFLGTNLSSELVCFKCTILRTFSELEYKIAKMDDIRACPNITKVFEKFEIDCDPTPIIVITSDFNEGGNLLEKYDFFKKRPSEKDVLKIIYDISNALRIIHRNGFIHRDIKPDNIMISNGNYKLIDFGLALSISGPKTKEGFVPYKSPEFLLFSINECDNYNEKVDIWALGIMMYHLTTGKLPYMQRNSDKKLLSSRQLYENAKAFCASLGDMAPFIPEPINSLIVSCLVYNPDDRVTAEFLYCNACKLIEEL